MANSSTNNTKAFDFFVLKNPNSGLFLGPNVVTRSSCCLCSNPNPNSCRNPQLEQTGYNSLACLPELLQSIRVPTPRPKRIWQLVCPRLLGVFVSLLPNAIRRRHRWLISAQHRTHFQYARSGIVILATAMAFSTIIAVFLSAQESITTEYRSKASFLATFPNFVDWPDGAFSSPHSPLIFCVLGDFHFGTTLAQISRDSMPHGRRVLVRWIRNDQQLHGCHILFVSSSELSRYSKVIALVQGSNTFTVGETTGFLAAGGMISIAFANEAIQFEVNLGSAREAHFHVSSRLLALARRVVDPTESTKG
jgi:hypothetical protein